MLHVTLWVHTVAPRSDIMSGNRETYVGENARAARKVPARPHDPSETAGERPLAPEHRRPHHPGQPALPAVHSAHDMFHPFSPLSGATVLSGEFFTITTSPISELS